MTEMTDVNIKLEVDNSSLSSSLLPSELEYSMPEGEVSKDYSKNYVSIYNDKYSTLLGILLMPKFGIDILEIGIISYLVKLLEGGKLLKSLLESRKALYDYQEVKKLLEDIDMKYFDNVGTYDRFYISVLVELLVELLPFRLCNSNSRDSLSSVLEKSTWTYVLSTVSTVLPLFATTVYHMYSPQDFQYQSCSQVTSGTVQVTPSSFNQTCGLIPINWYTKDFPSQPALSEDDDGDVCLGIASQISARTARDYALICQYAIYVSLIYMAIWLSYQEHREKKLTRMSIGLRGLFISCDDSRLQTTSTTFLKRYGTLILFLLACGYVASISIFPSSTLDWYIFPTLAAESAYLVANEPESKFQDQFYNAGDTLHSNWCNLLTVPIKITYVKYTASSFPAALLQAVLFLSSCYRLITSQYKIYDWMDCEKYMDASTKSECSYYDIHNYRNRVFSEPMLNDWTAVNVYYPVFHKVLHDPVYSSIHDKLSKKTVETVDSSLKSIHMKYSTKGSQSGRIE